MLSQFDIIIKGVFLIVLAVCGNFIAETLSCQTRKLLYNTMAAKHVITFMIIYVALGFTSDVNSTNPGYIIGYATIVYVLFLMFNRMDIYFTIMVFSLLCIAYVCNQFKQYYSNLDKQKYKSTIERLDKAIKSLLIISVVVIVVGFTTYFSKQQTDYSGNFSIFTFIFGRVKCTNNKSHVQRHVS